MTTDASPDQSPFVPQCLELRTGVSEGFYLVGEAAWDWSLPPLEIVLFPWSK